MSCKSERHGGGNCGCGCGCKCGCECSCGHSHQGRFRRRFRTEKERIGALESYLKELEAEVQGVKEHLAKMKKKK